MVFVSCSLRFIKARGAQPKEKNLRRAIYRLDKVQPGLREMHEQALPRVRIKKSEIFACFTRSHAIGVGVTGGEVDQWIWLFFEMNSSTKTSKKLVVVNEVTEFIAHLTIVTILFYFYEQFVCCIQLQFTILFFKK